MPKIINGEEVKITSVAIIRNEAKNLVRYFNHVRRFSDEVIVIDHQSTDGSLDLSLEFADKVFLSKNVGYKERDRYWARMQAKNEWVVELDPDEEFENLFIEDLPRILKYCEEKKYDGIICRNVGYWSGVRVFLDDHKKCRIAKKSTALDYDRVHTSVNPKLSLVTSYRIFHLKDLDMAIKDEEWRSKHYKDKRIENDVMTKLKTIVEEGKENKKKLNKNRLFASKQLKNLPTKERRILVNANDERDRKRN